jgi:hypothetical protein
MLRAGVAKAKAMDMRNFFGQPISKARRAANSAISDLNNLDDVEEIGKISESDSDSDSEKR